MRRPTPTTLAPLLLLSACLAPRQDEAFTYHSVEPAPVAARAAAPAATLRLRRVESAGYLGERIAVRFGPGRYELLSEERWTEPPERYLETALRRALFESGVFRRSESSQAATLDVDLRAFELDRGDAPAARVALGVALTDADGDALLDRSFLATTPLEPGAGTEAGAAALGRALDEALAALVAAARAALGERE